MKTQVVDIPTQDGVLLKADFSFNPKKKQGVIFAHGVTSDRRLEPPFHPSEILLQSQEISTLNFDFRGRGDSQGDPIHDFTIHNSLLDLDAAVSFMRQRGISHIGIVGASYGGSVASLYVAEHPGAVESLFLINPVLDFQQIIQRREVRLLEVYSRFKKRFMKNDGIRFFGVEYPVGPELMKEILIEKPLEGLMQFKGRVCIAHGDQDKRYPLERMKEDYKKLPIENKSLEIVPGAEHGFHDEPYTSEVAHLINNFF